MHEIDMFAACGALALDEVDRLPISRSTSGHFWRRRIT